MYLLCHCVLTGSGCHCLCTNTDCSKRRAATRRDLNKQSRTCPPLVRDADCSYVGIWTHACVGILGYCSGGFGNFGAQANASGQPATSTPGATGSPFGTFGQNQQQPQQPQAGASTTGAFGSSPFGASSTTGTQGTGTTGGGLFGSTPTAPAINVSTPGGSSTTPLFPSSGGAFGSSLNPPATGTASTSTSNLFPPASGSTAGAGTSTTSPFGAFGQQQPQQQNTNTAGPSMYKPSVFGAAPTTGFGASTAQPAQNTGAFGQSTLGASTLGASTLNLGQSTAGGNANAHTVEAQISAIEAAMTPGSPNNRFQVGILYSG